ncbi:MAG: efflux transporter outer membrane subunit [Desulfobulbaceae bacterium]|nr:efflux transporter outer membrane subunit [Desulfobulbaceae bacterium]
MAERYLLTWKVPDLLGNGISLLMNARRQKCCITAQFCFRIILAAAALQIASCAPFTAPDRSVSEVKLPPAYSLEDAVMMPPQRWWETFDSALLEQLVGEALAENQTLMSYWARVARAEALADAAGSELFPSITGETDASYTELHTDQQALRITEGSDQYSLGLFSSYEVDLWGRIRAGKRSADLSAFATREDLHAAAMTITAEVANRWIGIIANQQRMQLLQQQLETNRTYLELVELRFRKALASALDVMQQRQLVERIRARIPLAEMEGELLRNSLAVLLGSLPQQLPVIEPQPLPLISDLPPAGVPAQLLGNRPDIRAALLRLEAADQDFVVARADRLPALRLTGRAAYDSGALESLFDNWLVNLAAGLTAPLVDGGRRRAQADASAAQINDQLAQYRQTVLTAVREVEESLTSEIKIREHIRLTENELQAAKSALAEARNRYVKGLNDYLPVLTQLIAVQNLEIDLIARKEDLYLARINLYRALGGSWVEELSIPEEYAKIQKDNQS